MAQYSERFSACLQSSDQLVEQASKSEIAAAARLLAFHVAHYRSRYDTIPLQESLLLMLTQSANEALPDGVQILIDAIRAVSAGPESSAGPAS